MGLITVKQDYSSFKPKSRRGVSLHDANGYHWSDHARLCKTLRVGEGRAESHDSGNRKTMWSLQTDSYTNV